MTTTMTYDVISATVKSIFTEHFHIQHDQFSWEQPLESLQKDFKILSYLVFLEQLLDKSFKKKIPLIENISTAFHTPRDVVELIMREL